VGVPALQRAARKADLVVIDYYRIQGGIRMPDGAAHVDPTLDSVWIGKMELLSPAFVAAVRELVQGPHRLLATIMAPPHPVADEIKRYPGVHLLEVTPANRDALVDSVLQWLQHG